MFDRYTQNARRSIVFARHEAIQYPTGSIEAEHLLLGLSREDAALRLGMTATAQEEIRGAIAAAHPPDQSIPTSADLPLSQTAVYILKQAAAEADRLHRREIDTPDLVLSLLQSGSVTELLRKHGLDHESYRQAVEKPPGSAPNVAAAEPERPRRKPRAASLELAIMRLDQLVERTAKQCASQADAFGEQRLKRRSWSRKEAVGHLIDYAIAHYGWISRALTEARPNLGGRPEDQWVYELSYANYAWRDLLDVWESVNRLLIHVLLHLREEKLDTICRIGMEDPAPLRELVTRYVDNCEDIAGQILARG